MELVAENMSGKRDCICPNCSALYDDNDWDYTDCDGESLYRSYTCPGCKCQIEEVYNYSHVNAWELKGE